MNPDNNSVSFFDVRNGHNRRIAEVPIEVEPNGVAMLTDGSKTYVANTVSGTVSVIRHNNGNGYGHAPAWKLVQNIAVGTEPYGLALTSNGKKLYVSKSRSNSVSVIDTDQDTVVKTFEGVGPEPRGLAITNDGDSAGQDDAKAGYVTVISTATDKVTGTVTINPIADTGIKATGAAIARIRPGDPVVAVLDLPGAESVLTSEASASLPTPDTLDDNIQIGKELYNTSVGEFDPATSGGDASKGRMSAAGWSACAACKSVPNSCN